MKKRLFFSLMLVVSYLMQKNLSLLGLECLISFLLLVASGRRIKILPPLILFSSIVFANLLVKNGQILFTVLSYPITKEALFNGIHKAFLLIGMVNLSRYSFSGIPPGKSGLGQLLSMVLGDFNRIMNYRQIFHAKGEWIKSLDTLLFKMEESDEKSQIVSEAAPKTLPYAFSIFILLLVLGRIFPQFAIFDAL